MADADLFLAAGDRLPSFEAVLMPAGSDNDDDPVDLTDASGVTFTMRVTDESAAAVTGDATIVDAEAGLVRFDWPSGAAPAGDYNAEFVVTFSDGRQMTFPSDRYLAVALRPRLGA